MKNNEQNDSLEELKNDPVWDLLKHGKKADVSPFFARNVMREIRLHEDQKSLGGIFSWFGGGLKQGVALTGGAMACAVLLFGLFQIRNGDKEPSAGPTAQVEYFENEITESDMELASEIEAVEYLGQLMAVVDPGELSDAALADLLF